VVGGFRAGSERRIDRNRKRIGIGYRDQSIALAAQHKLPAVYFRRNYANSGGLISYGIDLVDQNRRAAGYVDRISEGREAGLTCRCRRQPGTSW